MFPSSDCKGITQAQSHTEGTMNNIEESNLYLLRISLLKSISVSNIQQSHQEENS